MASIYDPQGPQVALGGPSVSPGFAPVQGYDPSRQMLQAVEQRAQIKDREVEQLAAFSQTLGKFIQERGEEWKKGEIAKGFSKFISGGGSSLSPQYQQEHKESETRLSDAAKRDNQLANVAETVPNVKGVAAGIRNNSPALTGWQAYGYSIAQAQNAPFSLANYINKARSENAVIHDPDAGIDITLSPRMGREQAERAVELLTEKWSLETGISKINPQVLMEHAANNLAVTKLRLMEDWGKELDENAKAAQKDIAFASGVKVLGGITDVGTAASASTALEKILKPYGYTELNNEFPKILEAAYNEKVAAGDQLGATALLTNLGNTRHPAADGTVGTYRERFLTTFQTLESKLQEFGADQEKAKKVEQLALFKQEAERYDNLPAAQRDKLINDPTNGLLTRMRLAGMDEEDINKARTGGSTSFEIALLKGIRDGSMLTGANRITRSALEIYLANGTIDKSVYDQAIATPELAQQQTVDDVFKDVQARAERILGVWMTTGFSPIQDNNQTLQRKIAIVKNQQILAALSKLQPKVQALIDNNQTINITKLAEEAAALARVAARDPKSTYHWDSETKNAPNITKAIERSPSLTPPTFTSTLPKSVLDAVTNRISSTATPVLDPSAVDIPAEIIANEQLAVSQGGKVSSSVANIARASGYKDVNRYLSDQAAKNGMTWKPNPDQQSFIQNAKTISPSIAARLAGELTPSERRRLTQQLETIRTQQQTKASLQTTAAPGGTYATFQNDLIQREGGGTDPYGQYSFGPARSGPADPNLTNLRVRDVIRGDYRINGQKIVYFGAYQFKPDTFAAVVKKAGISMDAPFNKETQDRAFQAIVMEGALPWRNKLNDYMAGKIPDTAANRAAAIQDLQLEWTSMKKLTPAKLGSYLQKMRMEKQQPLSDSNLRSMSAPERTVKVGQIFLNMGIRPWQHKNFDIDKGYVKGGGRVGRHSPTSRHYADSALDLPLSHNSVTQLDTLFDTLIANAEALGISEVYWDRKGYYQNGKMIGKSGSQTIPGHHTHLHVSFDK